MSLDYTWEKLYVAVSSLVGSGSVKDRLHGACISALLRLEPNAEDFPNEELREKFRSIRKAVTRVQACGDEGDVRASVDAMSDDEAAKLAEEIFGLFVTIAEQHAEAQGAARR